MSIVRSNWEKQQATVSHGSLLLIAPKLRISSKQSGVGEPAMGVLQKGRGLPLPSRSYARAPTLEAA